MRVPAIKNDLFPGGPLTLAWADRAEKQDVINRALREGRQTMNLRTMPGAELAVLRDADGEYAGWAGMDVESDRQFPELFSQFIYPRFRGLGLGALLEHVWWAYLDLHGCRTGFMRMEVDTNRGLFERRLKSGYCRQVSVEELGQRFVSACRGCELFGNHCRAQAYLEVDVPKALAACIEERGMLDIEALPMRLGLEPVMPPPLDVRGRARTLRRC